MSLREELLAIDTIKREPLVVPEWPNTNLFIAQMNPVRNFQYTKAIGNFEPADSASRNATLVVFSVEDSEGNLLFQPEDVSNLTTKQSSGMISRIVTAIVNLYPDIEDTKKKSETPLS